MIACVPQTLMDTGGGKTLKKAKRKTNAPTEMKIIIVHSVSKVVCGRGKCAHLASRHLVSR
jgi:hypothetical protein